MPSHSWLLTNKRPALEGLTFRSDIFDDEMGIGKDDKVSDEVREDFYKQMFAQSGDVIKRLSDQFQKQADRLKGWVKFGPSNPTTNWALQVDCGVRKA